jgi:hypothetical protein
VGARVCSNTIQGVCGIDLLGYSGQKHCLGGGGGGRDSVIMLNSIWKCTYMYILYHCPKTFCH